MKTSVVIVNYNVRELILVSLRTLFQFHNEKDIEAIVVDNNSADGSCDAIRAEFPQVILIENNFNAGFPHANNQGFERATGDFIFMLNPDTEFVSPIIPSMIDFLTGNPEYGIVCPKLINSDGSAQQSVWRFPTVASTFLESFHIGGRANKKNYADRNLNEEQDVESCSGAAIFFPVSILKATNGLDETMFWIEDIEFCFRVIGIGKKIRFLPQFELIHHVGQSAKKNYNISISNQIVSKIKYFRKHGSSMDSFCVKLLSYIQVTYKIIVFGLLSPFKSVWSRKFRAYIYTFPRVFNPPKGIA